jgi:hypothetical protein
MVERWLKRTGEKVMAVGGCRRGCAAATRHDDDDDDGSHDDSHRQPSPALMVGG